MVLKPCATPVKSKGLSASIYAGMRQPPTAGVMKLIKIVCYWH